MSNKIVGPNGHEFHIQPDGRKVDEDGFICASGTPDQKKGPWFCVAVKKTGDTVSIRDTKDPNKTTLTYSKDEWDAFVEGVKKGEFD